MQRRGESELPVKGRRHRAIRPKARKARVARVSADRSAEEFDRIKSERDEALEQLAATSDVLKIISQSTFDLQSVIDTLVESVTGLCQAASSVIWRLASDGRYHLDAAYGLSSEFKKHLQSLALRPDGHSVVGRCLQAGKTIYVPDLIADPEYGKRQATELGGYRGLLCVPLMREGTPIGVLMIGQVSQSVVAIVEEVGTTGLVHRRQIRSKFSYNDSSARRRWTN